MLFPFCNSKLTSIELTGLLFTSYPHQYSLVMNIYIYHALIALLLNFFVISAASKDRKETKCFIPLVISFSLFNLSEAVLNLTLWSYQCLEFFIRAYYSLAILTLVCLYTAEISEFRNRKLTYAVALMVVFVACIVWFTDSVISGIRSIEYLVTAVKARGYILFQGASIALLTSIGFMLIVGCRKAESHQQQIKCASTLVAILPNVLVCLMVLALMGLGYELNAIGVIPITMMAFILITLATEESHKLTDIRRFMPGSVAILPRASGTLNSNEVSSLVE